MTLLIYTVGSVSLGCSKSKSSGRRGDRHALGAGGTFYYVVSSLNPTHSTSSKRNHTESDGAYNSPEF